VTSDFGGSDAQLTSNNAAASAAPRLIAARAGKGFKGDDRLQYCLVGAQRGVFSVTLIKCQCVSTEAAVKPPSFKKSTPEPASAAE
jgi:hypothetical protein